MLFSLDNEYWDLPQGPEQVIVVKFKAAGNNIQMSEWFFTLWQLISIKLWDFSNLEWFLMYPVQRYSLCYECNWVGKDRIS